MAAWAEAAAAAGEEGEEGAGEGEDLRRRQRQRLLAAQRLRFLQYLARLGAAAADGSARSQGGVAVAAKFKVR